MLLLVGKFKGHWRDMITDPLADLGFGREVKVEAK